MMFWFKPRKVYVDCFTNKERYYNLYAPQKAANFIPTWWKNLPHTFQDPLRFDPRYSRTAPTMKYCIGFRDLYALGFMLPMWSDVDLFVSQNDCVFSFADQQSTVTHHIPKQYGNNFSNFHHLKFHPPWGIKEKSGIKFAFVEPTWSFINSCPTMRVVPGITEYNLYSQVNVNMFALKRDTEYKITIEAGEPLCHLIPLTEKKVILNTHLVSESEFRRVIDRNAPTKFAGDFQMYRKMMKGRKKK